ncbi:MAG: phosphoenolpyruvate synthase, partial [Bacteroidia bacterium]
MRNILTLGILFLSALSALFSQSISDEEISRRIQSYKGDIRGPYKEIRWYCKDGTILPPQERCPEPGGVQRARHKEEVYALSLSNHVFLGQILSTTPFPDFWDTVHNHSRLKQYQLEQYLRVIDNGWVLRKAQYYRGAFQAEDESQWGQDFYHWLLADEKVIEENYFLLRQSLKDLPHQGDDNLTQEIRSVSRVISEKYPRFLDLRVKIHGQPEEVDLQKVIEFRNRNEKNLDAELLDLFEKLIGDMKKLYMPVDLNSLNIYLDQLTAGSGYKKGVVAGIAEYSLSEPGQEKISALSSILLNLRKEIMSVVGSDERLAVLGLSIVLEKLLMRELSGLSPKSIKDNLETINSLGMALTGCGYMELWEGEEVSSRIRISQEKELTLNELMDFFETGRRFTDWGIGMFRAHYNEVIDLYTGFEPLAEGFLDDQVRSSLLLYCGITLDQLDKQLFSCRHGANRVMDIQGQHAIRGLNPGYAVGELVVVSGQTGDLVMDRDKIYVFNKPPPDLKPVAGIATVSEGNMVSHVQLLARNLGIPNSVLSAQNLEELKKFSGQRVFYAVSS